jgi:hypothetical protein
MAKSKLAADRKVPTAAAEKEDRHARVERGNFTSFNSNCTQVGFSELTVRKRSQIASFFDWNRAESSSASVIQQAERPEPSGVTAGSKTQLPDHSPKSPLPFNVNTIESNEEILTGCCET